MGLDITAYEKVTLAAAITTEELKVRNWEHPLADADGYIHLYEDGDRPQADGMPEGYYAATGEIHGFRAGSYSGYSAWRRWLASLVGTTPGRLWQQGATKASLETQFYELIHFSDREGFIGPKTAAKLAKDFDELAPKARASGDEWSVGLYEDWSKAFHLAAKGGVVQFH